MKKTILLIIAFCSFTFSFAQKGPQFTVKEKDNTIDYGKVTEGEDGLRAFEFTNTGDAPLIITNVQSTCGCTVPSFPKEPIMPGKKSKIEVRYNMKPGPIRKTITVESNATNYDQGRIPLHIKGEVNQLNVLAPKKVGPVQ
ncbi:MAG: DUF1573 domain-containing protein [Flavobacterium sp.]|jgi:hypothetical protein